MTDSTPLSQHILAGFSVFWTIRLAFQWLVYDSSLWRKDRFRTLVHYAFSVLWFYLAWVYGYTLSLQT